MDWLSYGLPYEGSARLAGDVADRSTARPSKRVEEAMSFGVSTVRPSEDVEALVERVSGAGVGAIVVTSSDARLLGLLRRAEAGRVSRRRNDLGAADKSISSPTRQNPPRWDLG